MSEPLVSIIIPTYNRADLIGETLDSVLAQTHQNWECIVVDDGSSDHTAELLKTYCDTDARFKYVHRPDTHKSGGNGARNYGFELSKGEYIQWFDSDDVMLPEYVSERVKLFDQDLSMVICSGHYWDKARGIKEQIDLSLKNSLFQDYVLRKLKVFTPSILFKKQYLLDKELFSDKILRGQEAEFFSRLFFQLPENAYKIVNHPLFLYRQHSLTKTTLDKTYNFSFKSSQFYVHSENLKRGFIINDYDIIYSCYKTIILLLVEAINNSDKKLIKLILNYFKETLEGHYYIMIRFVVLIYRHTPVWKYTLKHVILNLRIKTRQKYIQNI